MKYGELTYEEISIAAEQGWLAVVPTGCTEQQGPHLPVDFDTWFAGQVCLAASDKAEKSIFKCPRATCRYWQRPPWEISNTPPERIESALDTSAKVTAKSRKPRKKVVRRRRVRRKK